MKKWLVCMALIAAPLWSHAAGYAAFDYVLSDLEPDGAGGEADVDALQFRFGGYTALEKTFGYEVRAALGMSDDEIGSTGNDVEIDRYYGAYLRAQFPDNFMVRPYGLLGVTRVETTETARGGENYTDVSLGFGAEVTVDKNLFVSLEYLRAVDRSGDELSNIAFGIGGRF